MKPTYLEEKNGIRSCKPNLTTETITLNTTLINQTPHEKKSKCYRNPMIHKRNQKCTQQTRTQILWSCSQKHCSQADLNKYIPEHGTDNSLRNNNKPIIIIEDTLPVLGEP